MLNLSKGGNINLAKEASGVTEFSIGWDVAAQAGVEFDLDVAAIPLNAQGKAVGEFGGWTSIDAMKRPTIAFL